MMPTVARLVAANAAVTVAAAASCSAPSATRISRRRYCVAATAFERGLDRGQAQPGALLGAGARPSTAKGVAVGEVLEGHQGGRVVLAQRAAQGVGVPSACPDRVLMGPGENLDRFRIGTVAGDWVVVVPVGAYQIGQQLGVGGIGFWRPRRGDGHGSGPFTAGGEVPQIPLAAGPIVVCRT